MPREDWSGAATRNHQELGESSGPSDTPWFQNSGLQSCETINICFSVTAAPANGHSQQDMMETGRQYWPWRCNWWNPTQQQPDKPSENSTKHVATRLKSVPELLAKLKTETPSSGYKEVLPVSTAPFCHPSWAHTHALPCSLLLHTAAVKTPFCSWTLSLGATSNLPSPRLFFLQISPCLAPPAYHVDLTLDVSSSRRYPVPLWEATYFISRNQPLLFLSVTHHLLAFSCLFVHALIHVHESH